MIPVYKMFMFEKKKQKKTCTHTHKKNSNNNHIIVPHVISESYKGTILWRYNSFLKFHGSQNRTTLYPSHVVTRCLTDCYYFPENHRLLTLIHWYRDSTKMLIKWSGLYKKKTLQSWKNLQGMWCHYLFVSQKYLTHLCECIFPFLSIGWVHFQFRVVGWYFSFLFKV